MEHRIATILKSARTCMYLNLQDSTASKRGKLKLTIRMLIALPYLLQPNMCTL